MGKRTKNINLHFMVNEEENELIKRQMAQSGIKSLRAYLLKMAVDGRIIHVELDSVREMIRLLSNEDAEKLSRKDLDKRLYNDIWSKGIPAILTSGTLSTNGDFSHVKRSLGIERVGIRIAETSKPSPFNHREGHGRGIRTGKDTCVIAIFDCRVGINGLYRTCVLDALPDCCVTDSVDDVKDFIEMCKPPEYFEKIGVI